MPRTKTGKAGQGGKAGNFANQRDQLLTLFDDPDADVPGKWRQSFGYEKAKPGKPFIARGSPKSSSGSK
jgi:hypothetical protein